MANPDIASYTPKGATEPKLAGTVTVNGDAANVLRQAASTDLNVTLGRSQAQTTDDQALWVAIRNRTKATDFSHYKDFIERVFCTDDQVSPPAQGLRGQRLSVYGTGAYDLLKAATETFLLLRCGVLIGDEGTGLFVPDEERSRLENWPDSEVTVQGARDRLQQYLQDHLGVTTLPYLKRIVDAVFSDTEVAASALCEGLLEEKLASPCLLELIWSYWHEEGMTVQTAKAISWRFQNKGRTGGRDPLAAVEIAPLRPLNNLFWGYIQDERKRLTPARRAYEYDHHYGITLLGRAVPRLQSADSRSKFLEGFHNLLYRASSFYREDADTTVIADGFSVLNVLKETHLLLSQGAHNQFGDLPWTARAEMLAEQWLLARPEIRDFLRGRAMVPYKEAWMSQVDTMKTLQGWTDVTITHFHNLAVFGEQLLLSVRYGDWIGIEDQDHAKNWARYWRQEVQGYIHGYRAVTGVDLSSIPVESAPVDTTMPAVHLHRRLARQARRSRR